MYKILFLLFITFNLFANQLKIASYNVENLFDLKVDNSEHAEFVPNSKSQWNEKNFNIKLNNLIKVIEDLDADIIALQEIENRELIQLLIKKIPKYKYYSFIKYPNSAIGLGFLSEIEIKENKFIDIKFETKVYRPILETTFLFNNVEFKIFNNHWPSKSGGESYRIKYAKDLQDILVKIEKDYDYILIGDFNSDYNEFETFKKSQRLNNSLGITGINHILNTTINDQYVTYENILKEGKKVHYNLWLDLPINERFSYKFRNQNSTPDSIILPSALFDNKKLSYIPKSFNVFKPEYLYKNNEINNWKMSESNIFKTHKGEGFSDHLPIFGYFSVDKEDRNIIKHIEKDKEEIKTISDLYKEEKLTKPVLLENVVVIYKNDEKAILKRENDRAIFVYKDVQNLKEGFLYDIQINQLHDYNGLKEVKSYVIVNEKDEFKDYKKYFIDATESNIFDFNNTNEIVTNLKGKIKNRRLYISNDKYIKLYSKNKDIFPKDGEEITITNGHLVQYKGNMQINIYKKSDYKVGN